MISYLFRTGANTSLCWPPPPPLRTVWEGNRNFIGKWMASWRPPASHHISRHDSRDGCHSQEPRQGSAIPSQILCSQQYNTCILTSSRTKTTGNVMPWHFTGWVNAAKSQQRDTSQASSLDRSSTLVYVVKLREININYPHKWPWKNVISAKYHQRHKQHNVLAEQ